MRSETFGIDTDYALVDAITRMEGSVFATGTQALVRLLVAQRLADRRDGRATAGFVSGYRGSPLAGLDTELWRGRDVLDAHDIRFLPGVNEDLAATAVSGTQRVEADPLRRVDGVFAMWYGKGPGVDRAGDAIRHGHAAGASRSGGVLLVVGDDHAATSSSIPNASDLSLEGWSVPIVHPASVDEYVEYGLWGWAASRWSGAWVAMKAISETVESSRGFTAAGLPYFVDPSPGPYATIGLAHSTVEFLTPEIERRIARRLTALAAFSRANPLGRSHVEAARADVGIVVVGKVALDVLEALERVGLPAAALAERGVRIWRPGLTFPLDRTAFDRFADGLGHILVVEEKASLVEKQIKDHVFNRPADRRPSVAGKTGLDGAPLVTPLGQLSPSLLAPVLDRWLSTVRPDLAFTGALDRFAVPTPLSNRADGMRRLPYFCSGCPHNSSTRVPEGSRALAGVGCHYMASWMDRRTSGLTQMGGEGVDWVGLSPFTGEGHVFQNMGEGTYYHSGLLAIRQAIAARADITYKILFNDAVAMTGGQPVDGPIGIEQILRETQAEGAAAVVLVSDDPQRWAGVARACGVAVHHRDDLDAVQRQLRTVRGVTILVYEQTCAAEKRRRRKKGAFPDPDRRMVINPEVCEGCGDCGKASNCLSIVPLATDLGRKRTIDQTSCNKDFSCVEGFCPSFVSVVGGRLRRRAGGEDHAAAAARLPEPKLPDLGDRPHGLLIAGVGGTGVITVGAVLAMAAHLAGLAVAELDFTALAQKGGSVMCHLKVARAGATINQPRIDRGEADAIVVADPIVGILPDCLGTIRPGHTRVLANARVGSTAEFTRDPDADPRLDDLLAKLRHAAGDGCTEIDANAAVLARFSDETPTNVFLIGHAWQQGLIPIPEAAILRAFELNGVAVAANRQAFAAGRRFAVGDGVETSHATDGGPVGLASIVADRSRRLADYQNEALAARYRDIVAEVAAAERRVLGGGERLSVAVAESLHKLMAYKDEYEVARLHAETDFRRTIADRFEGPVSLRVHLAPPGLARRRKSDGTPRKIAFGSWIFPVFRILARLKLLRGTPFDPFGHTRERREERRLIEDHVALADELRRSLSPRNADLAVALAELPQSIRGFGHVKAAAITRFETERTRLLDEFRRIAATASDDTNTPAPVREPASVP